MALNKCCHWLASLSAFSHLQLIQNSVPFTIFWRQCDIWITNDEFKCQNRVNFQMKFLVKKSLWKKEACPPNGLVSEKKVEQENHHFIIICACVTHPFSICTWFHEIDFWTWFLNLTFAVYTGSKNQAWNRKKNQVKKSS